MVLKKMLTLALAATFTLPQPLLAISLIRTVNANAEHTYAIWNSKK